MWKITGLNKNSGLVKIFDPMYRVSSDMNLCFRRKKIPVEMSVSQLQTFRPFLCRQLSPDTKVLS